MNADPKRAHEPAEIRAQRLRIIARVNASRKKCDIVIRSIQDEINATIEAVDQAIVSHS